MSGSHPLEGRTALVTGVSRRRGIGFAVANRFAKMGASIVVHHHTPHDMAEYDSVEDVGALLGELGTHLLDGARIADVSGDLGEESTPATVVRRAVAEIGHLDILICNHAHGGDFVSIRTLSPAALDRHWTVNTRATLLLTQAFARQHDGRQGGRVVWMTSGQGLGPMGDNLAYATSKAALAGATWSVADDLADANILLNTVNPGPVNTGYLDDAPGITARFPARRAGVPEDPARLIGWLVSDEGQWIVGQVLNSEGGFRR
jgi:3-oxoacyl-[acyl-carrier protein] reductase